MNKKIKQKRKQKSTDIAKRFTEKRKTSEFDCQIQMRKRNRHKQLLEKILEQEMQNVQRSMKNNRVFEKKTIS